MGLCIIPFIDEHNRWDAIMSFGNELCLDRLTPSGLNQCFKNSGHSGYDFLLAERFCDYSAYAFAGPTSTPGHFRFVVAVSDNANDCYAVRDFDVFFSLEGKLCAREGGVLYTSPRLVEIFEFIDQHRYNVYEG